MKIKRIISVLVILLACTFVPSLALADRDHLVPVQSDIDATRRGDNWATIVTTVFKEAFQPGVRARVLATGGGPGPLSADMLFLKERGEHDSIVYLHVPAPLWMYITPRLFPDTPLSPPDYRDLKVSRCEIAISKNLGVRLVNVWKRVLLETRYETKWDRGSDGGDLMFSMETKYDDFDGSMSLSGTIWSPDEKTKPGQLAIIVNDLQSLCLHNKDASFAKVDWDVKALEARFK